MTGMNGYDVVVCGGGPAGIASAVAAARGGARTLLIEQLFHLGGVGTGANCSCWCDSDGGPLLKELIPALQELGAAKIKFDPVRHHPPGRVVFEPDAFKALAARTVLDAGAEILYGTVVSEALMEGNTVVGVYASNKSGRQLIKARVVVDATADGDVAAAAGAEFLKGDPEDGRLQHCNFWYDIKGVDKERAEREALAPAEFRRRAQEALASGKVRPPSGVYLPAPASFPFHEPLWKHGLTYWELEKLDASDATAVSRVVAECQAAALDVIRFCRANLPGYEEAQLSRFPSRLGTRESRRVVGRYLLTGKDVIAGAKFPDGVARASFWIDFHDSPPGHTTAKHSLEYIQASRPASGDWYEIPYRCLVPKAVRGLLVAGRCISAEREAHASLRIMPTCFFMGMAAGTAASMAVRDGIRPDEVDGAEVRRKLNL